MSGITCTKIIGTNINIALKSGIVLLSLITKFSHDFTCSDLGQTANTDQEKSKKNQ